MDYETNEHASSSGAAVPAKSGQVSEGFGKTTALARKETAGEAVAAQARAEVESRYVMALRNPRNWLDVRAKLLDACKRSRFAEAAWFKKPVGKKKNEQTRRWEQNYVQDLSIRFAEEAARAMGNILAPTQVVYDDEDKRIIRVVVTDLESNLTYPRDVVVTKTVERRSKEGRDVLGQRLNTYKDIIYTVVATEDEILTKANAQISKALRTELMRLLPSDIKEECIEMIAETKQAGRDQDPDRARKKLVDAFGKIGVKPGQLEEYLGHDLDVLQPAERDDLLAIHRAIADGEAKWSDFAEDKPGTGSDITSAVQDKINARKDKAAKEKAPPPPADDPPPAEHDGLPEQGETTDAPDNGTDKELQATWAKVRREAENKWSRTTVDHIHQGLKLPVRYREFSPAHKTASVKALTKALEMETPLPAYDTPDWELRINILQEAVEG